MRTKIIVAACVFTVSFASIARANETIARPVESTVSTADSPTVAEIPTRFAPVIDANAGLPVEPVVAPDVESQVPTETIAEGAYFATSMTPPAPESTSPSDLETGSFECVCGERLAPVCSRWYGAVDALFLSRGGPGGGRAVVINTLDQNQNYPGPTLLTAGDAGVGTQIGPQVTIGRLCGDCGWETTYFGVFGASGRQGVVGNNDLAIPGALGLASLDFFASDQMTVTSSSELHSFEWNRVAEGECWTLLAGFRYLRLRESLNIRAGDPDTSGSDYRVNALNNLFGAQIGARRAQWGERFGWDFSAKVGLYGNSASQDQFVTDFPHPNPAFFLRDPVGDSTASLALVGELNLGLAYRVSERVTARVGYKILWLEGVATAADQLDFDYPGTSSLGVTTSGGTYFHGATAGLETRW